MPRDSTQARFRRQFTSDGPVNERIAWRLRLAQRGTAYCARSSSSTAAFRAIELVSIRDDRRDLTLFGHQEPLKLARPHGVSTARSVLLRGSAFDLRRRSRRAAGRSPVSRRGRWQALPPAHGRRQQPCHVGWPVPPAAPEWRLPKVRLVPTWVQPLHRAQVNLGGHCFSYRSANLQRYCPVD